MECFRQLLLASIAAMPVWFHAKASAGWLEDIGHTRLVELGIALPTSSGSGLSQVEAFPQNEVNYLPDRTSQQFTGKTFTLKSGTSGISTHADKVARNFYGGSNLLPGATQVDLYSASGWLGGDFLRLQSGNLPNSESRAVQNHSWVSVEADDTISTEANRRLDYAIQTNGFIAVVGMNNGNSTTLPQLLGQAYHVISVGRGDGAHSAGFSTLDGTGRIKPDIVAPSASPEDATSWTTPMVAASAGLLRSKLAASPYSLTGANMPRVVKALLLATATKDTVPSWANTSTRPLDLRYGAGELNLHHAWLAMLPGRAMASTGTQYGARRWAAESVSGSSSKTWYFKIPPGVPSTRFCAAMTWHRVVSSISNGSILPRTWSATMANLNLRLHAASGLTIGSQIAASSSTVDNVELIHQPELPPGDYALVAQNLSATATDMALAWHSLPGVSITANDPLAREIDGSQGSITITRNGDTGQPLKVPLLIGGTAIPGSHYQALPSSFIIPAGQSSVSLALIPVSDSLAQGKRTVTVAIAGDFALARDPTQTAAIDIEDKPFDAWRFLKFTGPELANTAISGETADYDRDGLATLIEYALGFHPKIPDPAPFTARIIGGRLALVATKNPDASDIAWSAEVSGNINTWITADVIDNSATRFEARDVVNAQDHPRRYIRLKITRL